MWQEFVTAIVSGLIGAGGVGAIVTFFINRVYSRIDTLEKDVTTLEKDRFSKLENEVKEHIKEDRSQQILTKLDTLNKSVEKVGDKVDTLKEDTATQAADIKSNRKYIENIDKSLQDHKREKH